MHTARFEQSALERLVREALEAQIGPNAPIRLPVVYANRGTFTIPIYGPSGTTPLAVLRLDAARSLVKNEVAVLNLVAKRASEAFVATVPRIIWHGPFGNRTAALQTFLPGKGLPYPRRVTVLGRQLEMLSDWLVLLYQIPVRPDELAPSAASGLFSLYQSPEHLQERVADPDFTHLLWDALQNLQDEGIPQVLTHADLHPGNILKHRTGVSVLDWEYATLSWPIFDWFHYICSACLDSRPKVLRDMGRLQKTLQGMFCDPGRRFRLLHEMTTAFFLRLGLSEKSCSQFTALGVFDFLRRRLREDQLPQFAPLVKRILAI